MTYEWLWVCQCWLLSSQLAKLHTDTTRSYHISLNINLRLRDRENKSTKLLAMKIGCAMKPTLKSVLVRLQSNSMDGERGDGVFHTPNKTNAFPIKATKARGKLTTQLAVMMTCSTDVSVIFPCVILIYQPCRQILCASFSSFQRPTFLLSFAWCRRVSTQHMVWSRVDWLMAEIQLFVKQFSST